MTRSFDIRIEPRATSSDLTAGTSAQVYDPLWMLGRQWQLGELLGEDAGSPVNVELQAEAAQVAAYGRGERADEDYDPADLPLEALAEAEPVRTHNPWTLRLRVDAGRELLRLLDEAGLGTYAIVFRDAYPIDQTSAELRADDPAAARLADLAAGRIPDGQPLYADAPGAVGEGRPPERVQLLDTLDLSPLTKVLTQWLEWCTSTVREADGGSAWRPDRLDYHFCVATSTDGSATRLAASEHSGGSLDWHAFDLRPGATFKEFRALPTVDVVPTGVRYRGMPNARWWEMEDASIDFGNVEAGASDSARLAMLEFGLVYANDFFAVPLRLALGSLCRITSLVVADTFGMQLRIDAAAHGAGRQGDPRWSMFTLSERDPARPATAGKGELFFLPPVAHQVLADRPVEELLLLRDEMANMAWAVEQRYEGERGVAEDRAEAGMRDRPVTPPPDTDDPLRYLLGTAAPEHWFPLVPVRDNGDVRLELHRNQPYVRSPRGTFLSPAGMSLPDAAVPREGRRLVRDYAFTRWSNGTGLVWSRRRSLVGRGEGSSGLRFDVAE